MKARMRPQPEKHAFVADVDAAAYTLIHSQHGDLGKALNELVMNAIDAGATECRILLGEKTFSVADDGAGFGSFENIMERFRKLGKSHKDAVNKPTFGRFGIGRGQIMPWGQIRWRSGSHQMDTDVKQFTGFEYSEIDPISGCVVTGTFYEPLSSWDLHTALSAIRDHNKHLTSETPIFLNGAQINAQNDELWDEETPEYRIRWYLGQHEDDPVQIFNQGALVCEFPRLAWGVGADVSTKIALSLNMARNAIQPKDPVWIKIEARLRAKGLEINKRLRRVKLSANSINEPVRRRILDALLAQSDDVAIMICEEFEISEKELLLGLPLIRDTRGKYHDWRLLETRPLTVMPAGYDREAETISMMGLAVPVSSSELRAWGARSGQDLIDTLKHTVVPRIGRLGGVKDNYLIQRYLDGWLQNERLFDFPTIASQISDKKTLVPRQMLSLKERAACNALGYASRSLVRKLVNIEGEPISSRKILIGESTQADGWTDSVSFIAIDRKSLKLLDRGLVGATQLILLLLHEYCHDKNNFPDCDLHGERFFERYHELSGHHGNNEMVGTCAQILWAQYMAELNSKALPLPKASENHSEAESTETFVCRMGPGKLSVFAKELLEVSGICVTIGRTKLTLSLPNVWRPRTYERLRRWVYKTIPGRLGLESPDDVTERGRRLNNARIQQIAENCADRTGYSSETIVNTYKMMTNLQWGDGGPMMLESLVRVLVKDDQSDVRYYTRCFVPRPKQWIIGNRIFRFNMTHEDHLHYVDWGSTDVRNNRGARAEFVIEKIKEMMSGLIDLEERRGVAKSLCLMDWGL